MNKNELKLIFSDEVSDPATKAFLRQDGKVEIWEKAKTGFWELNRCLDKKQIKVYTFLFDQISDKLK